MGAYIIGGASLAFAACEAVMVAAWRLAADAENTSPAAVEMEDAP